MTSLTLFFYGTFHYFSLYALITVSFPMGNESHEWGAFASLASLAFGDLCLLKQGAQRMHVDGVL